MTVRRLMLLAAAAAVLVGTGCHGRKLFCRDSDSSSYDACR